LGAERGERSEREDEGEEGAAAGENHGERNRVEVCRVKRRRSGRGWRRIF
jgi:hypothetical protein